MNARNTLSRLLPLSLTLGLLAPACDGGSDAAAKPEDKAAKADAKPKADEKAQEKTEEKKEEAKPAEPAAEADAKPAEPEDSGPAEEPAAAEGGADKPEEAPAEEPKAEEPKAEEPKPEEPKADKPKADKPKAEKPKADKPKAEPKAEPTPASSANGKEIYKKKCKSCHGLTGAADTKLAEKHDIGSWKVAGWKGKWSLSKVKDIVNNGKSGTKMKSFKSKLTADEIDAVSVYARSLGK